MRRKTPSDFWRMVKKTRTCWIWTGRPNVTGYASTRYHGPTISVHRLAWFLTHGEFPEWPMTIDHLCRNKICVNPAHMEVVTVKENVLRSTCPPALNAKKTHCPNGHSLTGNNVRMTNGGKSRVCRICNNANISRSARERRAKKRVA